ncbi:fungal-specific transcription factor domain-containing protein [Crepidotus variabilis]|uniref:Fungal-specific transcription factor domain-containing protein n=1 Tax=Crepidotus variabilis TaxID=179855 RepID=A0A9P6EBD5_9AGAR|nr:fungal-specific transcription factor domain-containing protein [Crepidotus variabilis]
MPGPHLALTEASIPNSIDFKANGEVSRMRNHKGNMPSLPQTKCCPLCPAKFTRTTHLNRHLRSHTNERAHRCDLCSAEFTRSDLLTRHKRTCGDSTVNRSRRKSCQACAESKVKCNLQHPCSKCAARGRDCVFINDPEASRNKKLASKRMPRTPNSQSTSASDGDFSSETSGGFDSLSSESAASPLSFGSHGADGYFHLISPTLSTSELHPPHGYGIAMHSNASDGSSSACSSRSSPRLEYFDPRQEFPNSPGMNFDISELDVELSSLLPTPFEQVPEEGYPSNPSRGHQEGDSSTWANQSSSAYGNSNSSMYFQHHRQGDQNFASGFPDVSPSSATFSTQQFSSIPPIAPARQFDEGSSGPGMPTTEDLNLYSYLFFAEFNNQIPLFHRPSWKTDVAHPILLRAMQACGALYAKTEVSRNFIYNTLASCRETVVMEFSKSTTSPKDHMCLILAVVLLQSIGLINPRSDLLSKSYHDLLIMMIRRIDLVKLISSWTPPQVSSHHSVENAWSEWARIEAFKRSLLLAYLQDVTYSMYYGCQPAFHVSELDINLPCDDTLWRAPSSQEWYRLLQTPSPYGSGTYRMLGLNMQMISASLREPTSTLSCAVNPFSCFILAHGLLRDVFAPHHSDNGSTSSPGFIQYALHNWQQIWSANPERPSYEGSQAVPLVCNPVPYFWLARFAETAKQNGTFTVRPFTSRGDVEERFTTIRGWSSQIQSTLLNGSQSSPNVYNTHPTAIGIPVFSSHA